MYIGIDLGTSGLKAVLVNDEQAIIAESHAALSLMRNHEGWSEQNPADWIRAAEQAFNDLAASFNLSCVKAIGLSGQMHGTVFLDKDDKVLRPAILWNDTRSYQEARNLDAEPDFRNLSGNIVFPGFAAPKAVWLSRHEPHIWKRVSKILLPKDYLRLWLSGEYVSEMSDASGTSWFNPATRNWSGELLEKTGLELANMPRLVEGSEVSAQLRGDIADRWGFSKAVIIAGGGGDNAASAIGMGVIKQGEAFVSLGTSGVLFAATNTYRAAPQTAVHSFCHALPQRWHQMGVILSCSDALNWFAALVGRSAQELTNSLGGVTAPGKTLFLPYLGGERTPLNSATIRGAFWGLEHSTDQRAATKAVLEGVSFALRDCQEALAASGTHLESLIAVGGGSRSIAWLDILANVLNYPIKVPVAGDYGAAFGAARLAMMALTGARAEDIASGPEVAREITPKPELKEAFDLAYERYKQARDAIGVYK